MIRGDSILVSLVTFVDQLPGPPAPDKRPRGCPRQYSDRLMLNALGIMIIRRLYAAYALWRFLDQDDAVVSKRSALRVEQGRLPSRRPWERRVATLPDSLPGLIGYSGRPLVAMLKPWTHQGRAGSLDSTAWATGGGGWHKQPRELGEMPHSSIDTAAGWRKSGWHGWGYGWKRHRAITVGSGWIALAAELPVANHAHQEVAPRLLEQVPLETRYVLGDPHYNDGDLRGQCQRRGAELVATRPGASPQREGGAAVRKVFHQWRSKSIEPFNGLVKGGVEGRVKMPVKGLARSKVLALGAIVIYQLALLYQHEHTLPVGQGIKPLLRAA